MRRGSSQSRLPDPLIRRERQRLCATRSGCLHGHVEKGVNEGSRVVRLQVVLLLADTDELDGYAQFSGDGEEDAALGRTVELGDDDTRQLHRVVEAPGLLETVLPCDGVEHQPHVLRFPRIGPVDDPLHLLQFLHQVVLGMQAAGRVDEQQVTALADAPLRSVESHRGRVAVVRTRHGRDTETLPPYRQLCAACGPEGVACCEHHLAAVGRVVAAQLGDGGGLADAVDADYHHYLASWLHYVAADVELEPHTPQFLTHTVRFELDEQRFLERFLERRAALALLASTGHYLGCQPRTYVRRDKGQLELVVAHLPADSGDGASGLVESLT